MGKKEIWGKLQQMILEIAGDDTIVIEQDTKLIEDCGFDSFLPYTFYRCNYINRERFWCRFYGS